MDLERALHKKCNQTPMAVTQNDETLCGCLWGLTEVIPDTEKRCETPVQFDAVYCVMEK